MAWNKLASYFIPFYHFIKFLMPASLRNNEFSLSGLINRNAHIKYEQSELAIHLG